MIYHEVKRTYQDYFQEDEWSRPEREEEFMRKFDSVTKMLQEQGDFWALEALRNVAMLIACDEGDEGYELYAIVFMLYRLRSENRKLVSAFIRGLNGTFRE